MSWGAAAERYARAIFELASEAGQLDQVTRDVQGLAAVWVRAPALQRTLENPVLDEARREDVLREVARRSGFATLSEHALLTLLRRRRLAGLPSIARRLGTLADDERGVCRASIVSAQPLPESYVTRLRESLSQALGAQVMVDCQEDPGLIGGLVTTIGDHTFDGSVAGRLEELERTLLTA